MFGKSAAEIRRFFGSLEACINKGRGNESNGNLLVGIFRRARRCRRISAHLGAEADCQSPHYDSTWIISSNQSDRALHTLPPGTALYFDKGFPEGFSRYKVYVNVDRMPLALRDLPDRNEIDPLDARPFDNHAPDDAFQE